MKLKVRNLKWSTGKPIIFLDIKAAKKLGVFVGNRVLLKKKKTVTAIVDITEGMIGDCVIGLSKEVSKALETKARDTIDVTILPPRKSEKYILKKFEGEKLNQEEMKVIIEDITKHNMTEAEIAYFISGQKLNGMDDNEIYYLTKAMIDTGEKISFGRKVISDKHSIGGVAGNRTTPLVVPICASLGLALPKTSSRAITSAAGTADVMETITKIQLELKDLKRIVQKEGGCMIWNSKIKMSPSDGEIIRVEKLLRLDIPSQLVASVMSKKISMGSKNVLIDVPYGPGSKIGTKKEAKALKRLFTHVGKRFGLNVRVVLTNGSMPIGRGIGPVLEMKDVLRVLNNEKDAPKDLKRKAIVLSTALLELNGVSGAGKKVKKALKDGLAYEKFKDIINAQNGKEDFDKRISALVEGKYEKVIVGWSGGKLKRLDNKKINTLGRILGSPDDKGAGVYLHKKKGRMKKGEKVVTLYSNSKEKLAQGLNYFWEEKVFEFG
ncbi:thymidine phosphorylase [Candidatus Pacearchaeota archaeon]|nr:thymidine phosphorylase [Candidatus Pacearchaeota archaeon]|tara:strand:- start:17743 stop:19221 length:1479 start_codon:yes stop_codon:yes gene_type:complete